MITALKIMTELEKVFDDMHKIIIIKIRCYLVGIGFIAAILTLILQIVK